MCFHPSVNKLWEKIRQALSSLSSLPPFTILSSSNPESQDRPTGHAFSQVGGEDGEANDGSLDTRMEGYFGEGEEEVRVEVTVDGLEDQAEMTEMKEYDVETNSKSTDDEKKPQEEEFTKMEVKKPLKKIGKAKKLKEKRQKTQME